MVVSDGYRFHGDPHKVFDDFFECNNPFQGAHSMHEKLSYTCTLPAALYNRLCEHFGMKYHYVYMIGEQIIDTSIHWVKQSYSVTMTQWKQVGIQSLGG